MTSLHMRVRKAGVRQLALDAATTVVQILQEGELRHADHFV